MSVTVKGKNVSTATEDNGNFSIAAGANDVLVITSVGLKTQEVKVNNRSSINISMLTDERSMSNIVVTALGIKRERRALGYSVTTVAGSSLTEARETNFVNGLEGKVAGVNVSNVATGVGGSSNVVIRGISDITGANQPLYVIDGIPMQNSTYRQTDVGGGYGGADGGDGTININPDDVETITVLKDLPPLRCMDIAEAKALY